MMEIRLLKKKYEDFDVLYQAFIDGKIEETEELFSDEIVTIESDEKFPIYIGKEKGNERIRKFVEAFTVVSKYYCNLDRSITFNPVFWRSLLCQNFRRYIIEQYPEVKYNKNEFNNIVFKKFDWENYIYKILIGSQYINDNISDENLKEKYFKLIAENLDLYNYIIKYTIFRNDQFLIKVLDLVDKYEISGELKAKIKDKSIIEKFNLGKDERVGRRVIFEFNKSYPVLMAPMMDEEEFENKFIEFLSYYYNIEEIPKIKNKLEKNITLII